MKLVILPELVVPWSLFSNETIHTDLLPTHYALAFHGSHHLCFSSWLCLITLSTKNPSPTGFHLPNHDKYSSLRNRTHLEIFYCDWFNCIFFSRNLYTNEGQISQQAPYYSATNFQDQPHHPPYIPPCNLLPHFCFSFIGPFGDEKSGENRKVESWNLSTA